MAKNIQIVRDGKKLREAKRSAVTQTKSVSELIPSRDFETDYLKHFIRRKYWLARVNNLLRDTHRQGQSIKYFTLPAAAAIDVRLFERERVIDSLNTPFVYCEMESMSYNILEVDWREAHGFNSTFESLATNPANSDYGKFWGSLPFDVINLDFWGDIHQGSISYENIYHALQALINQQSHSRKPYELWVTWRYEHTRVEEVIRHEYIELIKHNKQNNPKFRDLLVSRYGDVNPSSMPSEEASYIALLKLLLYVCKNAYSVIQSSQILCYDRQSNQDQRAYKLYNFLLRIKPWELPAFPSPACAAAKYVEEEYNNRVDLCFNGPVDVKSEFDSLSKSQLRIIKDDLEGLVAEYDAARNDPMKSRKK